MSDRTTVMYYYDGTYNGFLSCVFESFAEKETPAAILPVDEADQTCLFGAKYIETDLRRAERVRVSIPKKMGMEAQDLLERAFFTCMPEKELRMLEFMRLGYKVGRGVCGRLTEPAVDKITKAVQFLEREAHLYLGFLRFAEYGDVLIAQIEPISLLYYIKTARRNFCRQSTSSCRRNRRRRRNSAPCGARSTTPWALRADGTTCAAAPTCQRATGTV